jgi:hypothetical protein
LIIMLLALSKIGAEQFLRVERYIHLLLLVPLHLQSRTDALLAVRAPWRLGVPAHLRHQPHVGEPVLAAGRTVEETVRFLLLHPVLLLLLLLRSLSPLLVLAVVEQSETAFKRALVPFLGLLLRLQDELFAVVVQLARFLLEVAPERLVLRPQLLDFGLGRRLQFWQFGLAGQ